MLKYIEGGLSFYYKGTPDFKSSPKVYFCVCKGEREKYINLIADDIFRINSNAILYYFNEKETEIRDEEDREAFLHDLLSMQLFVIPVTSKFLEGTDDAFLKEFKFARDHNIPILPLMQEPGLEGRFNSMCGEIQFLDKYSNEKDLSAVPYEKKLETFLSATLFDAELIGRIKSAFAVSIFLSYRKKDRVHANELMKLIHKIPGCRDLAIWFDEFLVPGEKWYEAIENAMSAAELVTLLVTPNLLEPDNFIIKKEYPEAVNRGKEVLPVKIGNMVIDGEALVRLFKGISEPVDADDIGKIEDSLKRIALMENNDDPVHLYLIGLAYLYGINVEIDVERGIKLIKEAAAEDVVEAHKKLEEIYEHGKGVAVDYKEAYTWQESYINLVKDEISTKELIREYRKLEELYNFCAEYHKSYEASMKAIAIIEKAPTEELEENRNLLLGRAYVSAGNEALYSLNSQRAQECFEKASEYAKIVYEETGDTAALVGQCIISLNRGQIYLDSHEFELAEKQYRATFDMAQEASEKVGEDGKIELLKTLAIAMKGQGDVFCRVGKADKAEDLYLTSISVWKNIFDSSGILEDAFKLSDTYNSLGILYRLMKKYKKSISTLMEAIAVLDMINETYDSAEVKTRKAQVYNGIANAYAEWKKNKEAVEYYEKSIALKEEIVEASDSVGALNLLASSYNNLGVIYYRMKKYDKADEFFEKTVGVKESVFKLTGDHNILVDMATQYDTIVVNILEPDRNKPLLKKWYPKMAHFYELLYELEKDEDIKGVIRAIYRDYLSLLIADGEKEKAAEVAAKLRKYQGL